ncbi:MAG TPA: prepilin-type N-terminal cleavage/methylation domain-containing protein [Candidatus Limnocylindrales bacterium]
MNTSARARHAARGFSMVELLVTVLLAGIIFAAMVPVFASALKKTSGDNMRVTATNLAADRVEKIRMLNYADITDVNLNDPAFADNQFGATFTPAPGGNKVFTIDPYYVVDVPAPPADSKYKKVTVTVRWSATDSTKMQTVVMNPLAVTTGTTATSSATPSPHSTTGTNYSLVVSVTDNTVTSKGVTVVRTDVTPTVVQSPAKQIPNATNGLTVTWTGLVGGPDATYKVTVYYQVPGYSAESKNVTVTLIDDYPIYFDTNPYQ